MTKSFVSRISLLLLVGIAAAFTNCKSSSCTTLRQRDAVITTEYQKIKTQYDHGRLASRQYLEKLRGLRRREELLFREARDCYANLTDPEEHNYWFRGRLKFPSSLEMELQRMEEILK